jgi:hypothetical protein
VGALRKKDINYRKKAKIVMDMGKYFPCTWGKNRLFRELSEKSTRGHTEFIHGIESSLRRETLYKRREIIEMRFPR